jgi:hypothetical protein
MQKQEGQKYLSKTSSITIQYELFRHFEKRNWPEFPTLSIYFTTEPRYRQTKHTGGATTPLPVYAFEMNTRIVESKLQNLINSRNKVLLSNTDLMYK